MRESRVLEGSAIVGHELRVIEHTRDNDPAMTLRYLFVALLLLGRSVLSFWIFHIALITPRHLVPETLFALGLLELRFLFNVSLAPGLLTLWLHSAHHAPPAHHPAAGRSTSSTPP